MNDLENVILIVRNWANLVCEINGVERCYLFGSLIHRDGKQFIVSGAMESDIDLVVLLGDNLETAFERKQAVKELANTVPKLENDLRAELGRSNAQSYSTSIIPVTKYELYHGIHKGNDVKLFHTKQFIDISIESEENSMIMLCDFIDPRFHFNNLEAINCIKFSQEIRNKYLKINSNKETYLKDWDEGDPIPKEFMRFGALLNFIVKKVDVNVRTDLQEGLDFVAYYIYEKCDVKKMLII